MTFEKPLFTCEHCHREVAVLKEMILTDHDLHVNVVGCADCLEIHKDRIIQIMYYGNN